jgi:hypothetical protein
LEELFESFEELEEGELISLMDLTPSAGLPFSLTPASPPKVGEEAVFTALTPFPCQPLSLTPGFPPDGGKEAELISLIAFMNGAIFIKLGRAPTTEMIFIIYVIF